MIILKLILGVLPPKTGWPLLQSLILYKKNKAPSKWTGLCFNNQGQLNYFTSNRSSIITLVHAAAKSFTKRSLASALA